MLTIIDRVTTPDLSPENEPWDEIIRPDERISECFPDEFALYCERFINYFPKGRYFLKTTYDPMSPYYGWPVRKSRRRRRNLALVDSGDWKNLTDNVERHLDREQWMSFKYGAHTWAHPDLGDFFWLGLDAPKKISFNAIDFDNKRVVGFYRQGHESNPVLPVVRMPLEHFATLKKVYDAFPDRIWCITSETLGLDIIQKHDRPEPTDYAQASIKRSLARIGQGHVEVHPIRGRCKRRPFGQHYLTITKNDVLETWQEQLAHYENPGPTPSFRRICLVLLTKMIDQWRIWKSWGTYYEPHSDLDVMYNDWLAELRQVKEWLDADCPDLEVARVSCPETPPAEDRKPRILKNQTTPKPVIDFNLAELRNGNWVKGLEKLARDGLPCHDSVGVVSYEFAKWLWWVELFAIPATERTSRILALLTTYVQQKHNGFVSRFQNGQEEEVYAQLGRCIANAERLDENYRDSSLELFALIRQKRETGQYSRLINLAPLLEGSVQAQVNKSDQEDHFLLLSDYLYSVGTLAALDAPLPDTVINIVNQHQGRNRLIPYATRLINLLHRSKGIRRIPHRHLTALLGYEDRSRTTKYNRILIEADIINKDHYVRGMRCCGFWLTKNARRLMDEAGQQHRRTA